MFSGPSRSRCLIDLHVRIERVDRLLGGFDLRNADPFAGVDHLALEVGEIDVVVVDDPDRADAGGGEVQRRRRPEPTGAEQQHPGVEQLLLALDPRPRRAAGGASSARAARRSSRAGSSRRSRGPSTACSRRSSSRRSRSRDPRSSVRAAQAERLPLWQYRITCCGAVRAPRPRCVTRDGSWARAWRRRCGPRTTPRSHGRRSRRRRPRGDRRTNAGSTSSIRFLIWRRTSAPDGISNSPNIPSGFQCFTEYSAHVRASTIRDGPADRGGPARHAAYAAASSVSPPSRSSRSQTLPSRRGSELTKRVDDDRIELGPGAAQRARRRPAPARCAAP